MAVPFLSLQMKSSTGHHKVQSNAMKTYQKQQQYIYRHCQLCHVTTSCAVITQFAGGSTKYFGTYHAEFPKPKRDPASGGVKSAVRGEE